MLSAPGNNMLLGETKGSRTNMLRLAYLRRVIRMLSENCINEFLDFELLS
jgi:hypothetical protein